jgi:hypothetical protein
MWGSKKNRDDDAEEPQDDVASSRRSYDPYEREPNERSRLLDRPRPPNAEGYLDPDDPAVRLT